MKIILLALVSLLVFQSCDQKNGSYKSSGVAVTGQIGEILVVCGDDIWNSTAKKHLDTNLTQFIMPYFPDVVTFELVHKTPELFTQGVKRSRNTLFVQIDPKYIGKKGKIEKRVGVWATDQLVIDITANSYDQLIQTCQTGLKAVHAEFDLMEWKRIKKYYAEGQNSTIDGKLQSNFGICLALPDEAKIVTVQKDFFRIEFPSASRPIEFVGAGSQDPGTIFSGILVYQYDYTDSSQFALEELLKTRDTILRYNVPSEEEGLYMGTQYAKMVYPEGNAETNESGKIKGYEMRGMFYFTGKKKHTTGGAFWAFHFVHPKTKKLICISGYVDAPSTTSWTQALREVQAIWKSVEIK